MARAHFVKKARINHSGIKKGESYYWWSFRFGGKHYSKTPPRPSQLTQSDYLSAAYGLQEQTEDMELDDLVEVAATLLGIADDIRTLGSEQEDKISNMPDSLQEGATADLLRGRAEACEEVAGELEQAADEIEDLIDPDMDSDNPAAAGADEAQSILDGIGWNFDL